MRPRYILAFFLTLLFLPFLSQGQQNQFKQPRILILLDGSSSMVNDWVPGTGRFKAASNIIIKLMDSIYQLNPNVEFSLRVYGHKHHVPENNCTDTRNEVMFSKDNITQMELRLADIHPKGVSPIAYSLRVAAENDFQNERDYAYSLVLITDGGESCGGDICDVVQKLLEKKIQFKPYIVSLVDYAPLKDQYACLGTYLQATKPNEVPKVVGTITEAYRKLLAVPIAKPKLLEPDKTTSTTIAKKSVPTLNLPDWEKNEKVSMDPIKTKPAPSIPESTPLPVTTAPAERPRPTSRIQVDTEPLKKEIIAPAQPRYVKKYFSYFWGGIDSKKRRTAGKLTLPKKETDTVRTLITSRSGNSSSVTPRGTTTKLATPVKPKAKEPDKITEYDLTRETSKETTLQVYFTNGKGKFFSTTPRLLLVDPKTNNVVHRFFRTVDASGTPDRITVPAGNYDVRFESNPTLVSKSVTIQPQNNQKLVVTVHNAGLKFRYLNNENRVVNEYVATVKKLFDNTPTKEQPCEKIVEYEPGSYHVVVPTLPPSVNYIDLSFDHIITIDIAEAGYVQFTNANPMGKVQLFYQHGDKMEQFYTVNINGQPAAQLLRLQPGPYEARTNGRVQTFQVRSNATTELEIK